MRDDRCAADCFAGFTPCRMPNAMLKAAVVFVAMIALLCVGDMVFNQGEATGAVQEAVSKFFSRPATS